MGWFRPTLARRAPARASECWSAATVDTIYATAPPLGAFLRQTYRNLLGHQLQQKTHMPRLSSCDGRNHTTSAVELSCTLPEKLPLKALRRSFACWEQTTEASELPGKAACETPLQQRQRFTQYVVPSLARCAVTASATESNDSVKALASQTSPAAETSAMESNDSVKALASQTSPSAETSATESNDSVKALASQTSPAAETSATESSDSVKALASQTSTAAETVPAADESASPKELALEQDESAPSNPPVSCQAPPRPITSIRSGTPSAACEAQAAHCALLLTDIWLRNQAQRHSTARSCNAAASCIVPDPASCAAKPMKEEEAALDRHCQLPSHVAQLKRQLVGASGDLEGHILEADAPEHAQQLEQQPQLLSTCAEHAEDKTPAALTASTPTLASASASSSNITLSQARLTHVQCNDATSAKEDSASPRADCQMHSLAQPARTSAASMHSLREPVCGQHRSVLSGAQPPTQSKKDASPAARLSPPFAQRRVRLQQLLPAAGKAEAVQAALDRADALEAEARSAGQQRAGLIAHRDSLRAYQKASSAWDAAPNMYWDDPEALVQAALQRRAAQRKEQSASQAAPRIALPQRQRRAPQDSSASSRAAAPSTARCPQPATPTAAQSTPERRSPVPAEQDSFSFPQLRENSSSPESWQCNWGSLVAAH